MKRILKKVVAWPLAEACFWIGHFWSKPLGWSWPDNEENAEKEWVGWYVGFWYVPYNNLMTWSLYLSDWADLGLWKKCKPGEDDDPCADDEEDEPPEDDDAT